MGLGALAIPGIGPVLAGGALATAFGLGGGTAVAGAGIGAAAGGLVGALVGMGIPEADAQRFEEGFNAGGVLVTVNGSARRRTPGPCWSATAPTPAAGRRPEHRPRRSPPIRRRPRAAGRDEERA